MRTCVQLMPAFTWPRIAVTAVLVISVGALLATAPTNYDFANADAPRHALNGAFVLDAMRALPWRDPMGFAAEYYLRYPSLSIGFYPPLFYVIEAAIFAVAGVSHFAAQMTVALFTLLLAGAAYRLGRLCLPRWTALGAALLLLGAPETALWSRQVMLDVPVHAMLMIGVLCFARHLRNGERRDLWFAAMALVAALYIKFTVCFVAVPLAAALIAARGWRGLLERRFIFAVVAVTVLALPALGLTFRFGMMNLENVAGHAAGDPVDSFARWAFYLEQLPEQLGWLPTILAVPGTYFLWRRASGSNETWLAVLLAVWVGFGFLFFSAIRVHERRHDLMILFPVILAATSTLTRAFEYRMAASGKSAVLVLGGGTLLWSLATPVPRLTGYAAIAENVAVVAPANAIVLFSAFRDGNFVFAMRARGNRPDISIVRANKWLLRFAVDRHWGITQSGYDRVSLAATLHDHGIAVAVAQRGFWDDLEQMALLRDVLHDPAAYRPIAALPIGGDLSPDDLGATDPPCVDSDEARCHENKVEILLPLAPPPETREPIEFDLPFLGQRLREHSVP
jgi:4-amino-4-deoxy-L-arabinose transferase-like glycosyltransferase